jgi:hypothetical protein
MKISNKVRQAVSNLLESTYLEDLGNSLQEGVLSSQEIEEAAVLIGHLKEQVYKYGKTKDAKKIY